MVQDFAGPSKIYEFSMEGLICFSWIVGLLNSFRCPAIGIREDIESIINGIPELMVNVTIYSIHGSYGLAMFLPKPLFCHVYFI